MSKLRPAQIRSPAKKLTPEVVKANPFLRSLIVGRLAEISRIKRAKKSERGTNVQSELDLD
jgi:hypothetical protein